MSLRQHASHSVAVKRHDSHAVLRCEPDMRGISLIVIILLVPSAAVLLNGCSTGQSTNPVAAPASVNADPKTLRNPIPSTPESLAVGKRLYDRLCANCHGASGNGVSELATTLVQAGEVKPSDLTDDKWDHGSTDGEIFVDIRDGVGPNAAMRGLNGKPGIDDEQMWHLVNYVRNFSPHH